MIPDINKAKVLLEITNGKTVSEAATSYGYTMNQAHGFLSRFCPRIGLKWDLDEINTHPKIYRDAALKIIAAPRNALESTQRKKLIEILKLDSQETLTPHYVSNYTAELLMSHGVTKTAIADIQAWLLNHGLTLIRRAPDNDEYLRSAEQAIYLLDAFGFDVSVAKSQFDMFEE